MSSNNVMIATNSGDHPNYHRVVKCLEDRGYAPFIFESDSIANGSAQFSIQVSDTGSTLINYKDQVLDLAHLGAAWCRRPSYYGHPKDQLRWLMIKSEYEAPIDSVLNLVPKDAWLNAPGNMREADTKIPQLLTAARLGFEIPISVIANEWDAVEKLPSEEVVVKFMTRAVVPTREGGIKALVTNLLQKNNLPKQGTPYPGLWQTYIPKKREWRVTVVGDKVFSAAIYTSDKAKNDWREHQRDPDHVTFKAEKLPSKYEKLCVAYVKHYSLLFGAFDLVERPDGTFVFLEINVNGQFMWVEEKLGLPISAAIADALIEIAERRTRASVPKE